MHKVVGYSVNQNKNPPTYLTKPTSMSIFLYTISPLVLNRFLKEIFLRPLKRDIVEQWQVSKNQKTIQ